MSIWYPCVYCTEDLKCTKHTNDEVVSYCLLGPCHDETPSHADGIRAMTDEELADWIAQILTYHNVKMYVKCERSCPLYKCCNDQLSDNIEDWLKSPADKEEEE